MAQARIAVPRDAAELVRLRALMLSAMAGGPVPPTGEWAELAEGTLRRKLAEPVDVASMAAFVVDRPDGGCGLAACAVGTIELRLGGPEDPAGAHGCLFNVSTDPAYRRRGFARACVTGVLGWFRRRGLRRVDLKSTPAGEPLYRSMGFVDSTGLALKLTIPDRRS